MQANIGEGGEASTHGITVSPVSSQGEPNLSVVLLCLRLCSDMCVFSTQALSFSCWNRGSASAPLERKYHTLGLGHLGFFFLNVINLKHGSVCMHMSA